jgi:hypothetical protein
MSLQSVQERCDTCDESAFLYRLCGTTDALCAPCFLLAYPVPTGRPAVGPAAAGCLRGLRTPRRETGLHRFIRVR